MYQVLCMCSVVHSPCDVSSVVCVSSVCVQCCDVSVLYSHHVMYQVLCVCSVVESPRDYSSCPSHSSSGVSSSSLLSSDSDSSNPASARCYSSFEELPLDGPSSPVRCHTSTLCQKMEKG